MKFIRRLIHQYQVNKKVKELVKKHSNNGVRACIDFREWMTPERIAKFTSSGFMKVTDSYYCDYPQTMRVICQLTWAMNNIKNEMRKK